MSLTEGNLRLFKFVPDEFVAHLPRYSACGLAPYGASASAVQNG